MDISGDYRIPAPQQAVWEALSDPVVLQACIPGCKELVRESEHRFAAVVTSKVGPISATFRGHVELRDLDPPNSYTLTGQGQGGAAGFARMKARVSLAADGEATSLHYDTEVEVGGKLAAVGSRLVQAVAKKNADDFFAAFAARLGGAPLAPPAEVEGARIAETAATAQTSAAPATPAMAGSATAAAPTPAGARQAPALAPWVIAMVSSGFGVVLGFVLGRLCH